MLWGNLPALRDFRRKSPWNLPLIAHTDDKNVLQDSRESPQVAGFTSFRSKPVPHHQWNGQTFWCSASCGRLSHQIQLIFYSYFPIIQISLIIFYPVPFNALLPHTLGGMRRGINKWWKLETGKGLVPRLWAPAPHLMIKVTWGGGHPDELIWVIPSLPLQSEVPHLTLSISSSTVPHCVLNHQSKLIFPAAPPPR